MKVLDSIVSYVKENPESEAEIIGHCESLSDPDEATAISRFRADGAAGYLTARGIEMSRLHVKAEGIGNADVYRSSPIGRKLNRNVEIRIISR